MSHLGIKHSLQTAQETFLLRFRLNTNRLTDWVQNKTSLDTFSEGLAHMPTLNLDLLYRFSKTMNSHEAFGLLVALMQFEMIENGQESSAKFKWLCSNFPEFAIPRQMRMSSNSIGNWIHTQFIAVGAPYELNLSAADSKSLNDAYQGICTLYTSQTFDQAKVEAIRLLRNTRYGWDPSKNTLTV